MKALIRKVGLNGYEWEQDTVMIEPFPQGTDEIGRPYTLDGYRYALCVNVPDGEIVDDDPRLDADNYDLIEQTETVEESGEQVMRKYWTATYTGVRT